MGKKNEKRNITDDIYNKYTEMLKTKNIKDYFKDERFHIKPQSYKCYNPFT